MIWNWNFLKHNRSNHFFHECLKKVKMHFIVLGFHIFWDSLEKIPTFFQKKEKPI